MTVLRHLIITAAVTATACTGNTPERPDNAALTDTLKAVIANAYDFTSPDVLTRMNALYPDSGEVVSASAGQIVSSADSVRAGIAHFWQEAGQNMRNPRWVWDQVHVTALGSDAAVLTGTWSIPHIAPHGGEHIIRGAWTAAFRRSGDGRWQIVHEHLSAPGNED